MWAWMSQCWGSLGVGWGCLGGCQLGPYWKDRWYERGTLWEAAGAQWARVSLVGQLGVEEHGPSFFWVGANQGHTTRIAGSGGCSPEISQLGTGWCCTSAAVGGRGMLCGVLPSSHQLGPHQQGILERAQAGLICMVAMLVLCRWNCWIGDRCVWANSWSLG